MIHRPTSQLQDLQGLKNLEFCVGDILDKSSLLAACPENVDVVFHLAASVGNLPNSQESTRYDVNQLGTRNTVEMCLQKKVKRLVQTSTVLVYDYKAGVPVNENSRRNMWSHDAYIQSKRLADEECEESTRRGLDVVFVHPTAVFGAYDRATWSKLFREIDRGLFAPLSPPGRANICHSRSVAQALISAAEKGVSGAHYILGGPEVSWHEVMVKAAQLLKKPGPRWPLPKWAFVAYGWCEFYISTLLGKEPALTPHTIRLLGDVITCDDSKARKFLNYESGSVHDMLSDCHQWMIKEGLLKNESRN